MIVLLGAGDGTFTPTSASSVATGSAPVSLTAVQTSMAMPNSGSGLICRCTGANNAVVAFIANLVATSTASLDNVVIAGAQNHLVDAVYAGDGVFTASTSSAILLAPAPKTAEPQFSPEPGSYAASQTVNISDATSSAAIYYTSRTAQRRTTSSMVYAGPISVSASETIEAIALASGYLQSDVMTAPYSITSPGNSRPTIAGVSPAYINAGGPAITITVDGTGFTSASTVYWGTNALITQFVSATQLTA